MKKKVSLIILGMAIIALVVTSCTQAAPTATSQPTSAPASTTQAASVPTTKLPSEVRIVTHNVGGTFHTSGVGVAKIISDKTSLKVVVVPTQGPSTYVPMLNSGEMDIGFPNNLDAYYAFVSNPDLGYKEKYKNIRMLVPGGFIPPGLIPLIVRKDSAFKTLADIKGKRVAGGMAGQRIQRFQEEAHLALGGMTWSDVVEIPVADYTASLTSLKEGRVDVAFGGTYNAASTLELNAAIGIRALPMDPTNPAYLKRFKEILPGFDVAKVGPDAWLTEPTYAFTYKTSLITNSAFNEDAAYAIVKCVFDNWKEIAALKGNLANWEPKAFFDPAPQIPYHPATVKYYKEQGLWAPAVDKIQTDLLALAK